MALRAGFGAVQIDPRSTSNHEKPLWGSPSGLPPAFRPARNFTSAGSAGDLVASVLNQPESRLQRSDIPVAFFNILLKHV
jgi:hypothetical protein